MSKTVRPVFLAALMLTLAYPYVPAVKANVAPNNTWLPAGPSMNAFSFQSFTDQTAELTALQSGQIDLPDSPCPASLCASLTTNPNFFVTSPTADQGYGGLEFHLGQNFWGCQMSFGDSACGVDIRQAFSHGIDKNQFVGTELGAAGQAIDNPVPPSVTLNSPNTCSWDPLFAQTGSQCIVNGAGGTAYHLSAASSGSGCTNTPGFGYTPGCGTQDFCAAADHLIHAGLAAGKSPTTCVLTGVSSSVTANPIHIFVRLDETPLFHLSQSLAQFICALFTGSFSVGCTSIVVADPGPITAFPGLQTSPTSVQLNWWVFANYNKEVITPDQSLFFRYDSESVSGIPSVQAPSGPCSAQSIPSYSASNYVYLCNAAYDTSAEQMEYSPCLTNAGDPQSGQTIPTFANCPSTTQPTAASAGYQAQDTFGKNAFTIPVWSGVDQYSYLSNWQGVINSGDGITNAATSLNAHSETPSTAGTVRTGLESADPLNPYTAANRIDWWVIRHIYDTLYFVNPLNRGQVLDWMTIAHSLLPTSALSYTPPVGTVLTARNTLRSDNFWHDGLPVTAYDVAFSYLSLIQSGSFIGRIIRGFTGLTGITVLTPYQLDFNFARVGPWWPYVLALVPILPGHVWSAACSGPGWVFGPPKGETVIYDVNANNVYDPGVDVVAANPTGVATGAGAPLLADAHIQYVGGATWTFAAGNVAPVIYDVDAAAGNFDPVNDLVLNTGFFSYPPFPIFNGAPHLLSVDPKLKYVDANINGVYDAPIGLFTGIHTYMLGSSCMTANPAFTVPAYDPSVAGTLIGSGPWVCERAFAAPFGVVGNGCKAAPFIVLIKYGCTITAAWPPGAFVCKAPGTSLNVYFRSGGNLALWIWSRNTGDFSADFVNFAHVASCFGTPVGFDACSPWQEGIGNSLPVGTAGASIGIGQAGVLLRFVGINWVGPYAWAAVTGLPAFPPATIWDVNFLFANTFPGVGCVLPGNGGGAANGYPNGGGYNC